MYSINAKNRTVKLKDEGNRYVPLDTAEFDDLLDKVTKLLHSTHQERMEAADIKRKLETRAAAERAAREAAESVTRQLAEKQREEQAQQADKLEYERKLVLLYTKVEAETAQEGWLDIKLVLILSAFICQDFRHLLFCIVKDGFWQCQLHVCSLQQHKTCAV